MAYPHEKIRRINPYHNTSKPSKTSSFQSSSKDAASSYTYIPVLIIGAGESGIAMGCRLKSVLGFDQFRIYDRQSGVGGTWWINRYPGVACDIPALLYSFSFAQNPDWSQFFPEGKEIQQYFSAVCDEFGIQDKIHLNTAVEEARWSDKEKLWAVDLVQLVPGVGDLSNADKAALLEREGERAVVVGRETVKTKVLISGVGGLVEPNAWPEDVKGREKFKGTVFHSARWKDNVDFQDKNVVVLGTGCTAAQLVPRLIKPPYNAKKVLHLMRSPPWIIPKGVASSEDGFFKKYSGYMFRYIPGFQRTLRLALAAIFERWLRNFYEDEGAKKRRAELEGKLKRHIKRATPDKYHEILTPDYGVGCKRRIFDDEWFPSLNDDRIELNTQPLTEVHEKSITIGPGRSYPRNITTNVKADFPARTHPADIIVLANGFAVHKWGHPIRVIGRSGETITDVMASRGGSQAYMGITLDGFPNFFILFGPNSATGHTSAIINSENTVNYALKFVEKVLSGDVRTVEVKREEEERYTSEIQGALKGMVWRGGGCRNWYLEGDWNGTTYPYSQVYYTYKCMFPIWSHYDLEYTSRGIWKDRLRKTLEVAAFALALIGAAKMQRDGVAASLMQTRDLWRATVGSVLDSGIRALNVVRAKL